MARRLFGTDGIRGAANVAPMTADTALAVAMAAAAQFRRGSHRHLVVIGKDTRLSGYMLEPAMTAGFIAMGMDVVLVGPLPTPAVAMLTRSLRADLGVVISASHNAFQDNGIKLFGPDGYKLSDAVEMAIEAQVLGDAPLAAPLAGPRALGRARRLDDAGGRYIEAVKAGFPKGLRLDGLKIVVDCANGAAYRVAPTVLYELGAEVVPIAVQPDGFNINAGCGATAPDAMRTAVVTHGAQLGIALDGDADRVILADETGRIIDGDQLLALIGSEWAKAGRLTGGAVVATVMSNLGLERLLAGCGIGLVRTAVGDRHVVEEMHRRGCNVGGEASGHIVLGDLATTGDGLVAALQVLAWLVEQGRPASRVARLFEPVPQRLKSVRTGPGDLLAATAVAAAIAAGERRLGRGGRVLVRRSGTEPVIRVMAEGDDAALVDGVVDDIVAAIAAVDRGAAAVAGGA
ncbi:MAG: phosphoglucosamine mutase [Alphaproteobacteria bacterium]|nr:phosphoglucosamine mutase [Alphaproteobacteria bacterium]